MPSLTDKLKEGGANQSVNTNTSTGQQSMSLMEAVRQSGATVPTSPLSASSIGGVSPDTAKMVGTPAQTKSANKSLMGVLQAPKIQVEQSKSEARQSELTQQYEVDQAAKDAQEVANRMSNLGSFGKRLPNLIMKEAVSKGKTPEVKINPEALKGSNLTTAQQTTVTDIINNNQGLSGLEIVSKLTQAGLNIETLKAAGFISAGDAQAFADAVGNADSVKIGELFKDPASILNASGYKSVADLEAATGLKNVGEMTYGQLKQALAGTAAEYSTPMELQQIIANPAASGAAKMDAAKQLRRIGATGQRTAEEKINDLVAQVVDGDKVRVDGKDLTVEEMLEDKNLLPIIKDALDDTTGQGLKDLEEVSPELAKWVKTNIDAVKDWVSKVETGTTQFAEVKAEEKKLAVVKTPPGVPARSLSDGFMEWVTDGKWGDNNTTPATINSAKKYVMDSINEITDQAAQQELIDFIELEFTNSGKLDELYNLSVPTGFAANGTILKSVPILSKEGRAILGLDTPGGISKLKNKITTTIPTVKQAKADVMGAGGDGLIKEFTGDFGTYDDLVSSFSTPGMTKAIEFIKKNNLGSLGLLDSNNDGVIDDKATLVNNLLRLGGGSIQDILNGKGNADQIKKMIKTATDFVKSVETNMGVEDSGLKVVDLARKDTETIAIPALTKGISDLLWDPNQNIFNEELLTALDNGDSTSVESILLNDPTVKQWITNYDRQLTATNLKYSKAEDGQTLIKRLMANIIPQVHNSLLSKRALNNPGRVVI